ncbi:MAG: DUF2065 domain-containing protein [Pseudomonadota bacterium]
MWRELLVATALMLVLEGIMPFLSPRRLRRTLIVMIRMNDTGVRMVGLASMLMGLLLLYSVN